MPKLGKNAVPFPSKLSDMGPHFPSSLPCLKLSLFYLFLAAPWMGEVAANANGLRGDLGLAGDSGGGGDGWFPPP